MLQAYQPSAPVRWTWITLTGPDGADFLHRLTTLNVRKLAPGSGAPGFFLTPQGKVRSYFTLWCLGHDRYAFEFDAGLDLRWKKELETTIDQFTFGEKFALEEPTGLVSRWIFADNAFSGLAAGQTREEDGVRICHHGARDFGAAWLTLWGPQDAVSAWLKKNPAKAVTQDDLTRMRILSLRPWVDAELVDSVNPLEIGLRDAIADAKGCYPGQEVIEKIISLGAPARRLVLIRGEGAPPTKGPVLSAGAEIGSVTSASSSDDGRGYVALALVRKTHAQKGTAVEFKQKTQAGGEITEVADAPTREGS
jgi:folate-binding protein YgfZ